MTLPALGSPRRRRTLTLSLSRKILFALALSTLVIALPAQDIAPAGAEKIYSRPGHRWFEDASAAAEISSDVKWAIVGRRSDFDLVSLATKKPDPARLRLGMQSVDQAAFCGGDLLREGKRGTEQGWFVPIEDKGLMLVTFRPDPVPLCSTDAKVSAYFRARVADAGLLVGNWKERKKIAIPGVVTGAVFSPDAQYIYVLSSQPNGGSTLSRVEVSTSRVLPLAKDLDAAPSRSPMGISADGARLYLSLASLKLPDPAERQKPVAPRFLDLHEFNLKTNRPKKLIASDIDKTNPAEAGGYLYWSQSVVRESVVVLPAAGGLPREVAPNAFLPSWRRDGKQIGFAFGDWRHADWALNIDAAAIAVDDEARPVGERTAIISGNHEDFPPEWSPDGKWIAFHSHRASAPAAYYDAPGAADDIWLRLAEDPQAPEIRLTDFGWEVGSPNWSPDGRKLLFSSWQKGGAPGIYHLWVTTIDPETGRALSSEKLPLPSEAHSPEWAVWSPSGEEIAIEDESGPGERTIWVLSAEKIDRLISYKCETYGGLDWTPDGKAILYGALDSGRMQIFSIARSGGAPAKLTSDPAGLMHPRVSPDGKWIAATRHDARTELWRKKL
jgi:Tol biopolymer transport system component